MSGDSKNLISRFGLEGVNGCLGLLNRITSQELFEDMVKINHGMGGGTIRLIMEGVQKDWMMKRERISQEFMADWDELLIV